MKIKSNGCIYQECYNPGNNQPYRLRYVAEIHYRKKRFRFRSTNPTNVEDWLQDMRTKIAQKRLKDKSRPRKRRRRKNL